MQFNEMNKAHPDWNAQVVDLSAGIKRTVQPYVNNGTCN